jgi:uncharacterized protein (DUF362 family)
MSSGKLSALPPRVGVVRQSPQYDEPLVRQSVRRAMDALGLRWRDLIQPGQRVLLKPNFIRESHTNRPGEWEQIITHGTVIAAVAEQVAAALDGRGTITIADAPQTDSDFDKICERAELPALRKRFSKLQFEILDLRREAWRTERGVIVERRKLPEDPRGYTLIDLAGKSCFAGKAGKFYGADYDAAFTAKHHSNGRHEYLLSRSAMDADVFINLPKLKTHKKVGVTLSLKNLVGINGDKNYLPHFSIGTPDEGGDEFPDSRVRNKVQSKLVKALKGGPWWTPAVKRVGSKIFGDSGKVVRSGNWHGNDTTWRMVLDLNQALFQKPRRYLSIVDGIIAGEGNGPMEADAKPCGVLIAGTNPVAVDFVCVQLMGFDWRKLPMIREGLRVFEISPDDIVSNIGESFRFKPHFGWVGHVEKN